MAVFISTHSGSGRYEAADLESAEVEVRISGTGSATIRERECLNANISGSGSVRYIGRPAVWQTTSGSGKVEPIGD